MWSTILLLGSAHGVIVALLLLRARGNRIANRLLAALLVGVVLLITPYTIGYAGFYDAYPWLSFAPLDWRLGFGPLIYLYVRQLGAATLPRGWGWHLGPALVQGGYYAVIFAMPLAFKNDWDERVHVRWIVPVEACAMYASMAVYGVLAARRYRATQRWLEDNSAAREEYRMSWVRGFLLAFAAVVAVQLGFDLVEVAGARLDYFDRFPLYLAFTALVYFLGIEGWRNAERRWPEMDRELDAAPDAATATATSMADTTDAGHREAVAGQGNVEAGDAVEVAAKAERDWAAIGQGWAERVTQEGWWREPELSLADLARRLGTNTRYLSRAFNEGLGVSFSELINRQRVEEAKRRLGGEGEILAIALEVGFASKASFNRAFKAYAGCTPSEFRAGARRGS
ncbi:MAG: AraC family transcriptional regulator [Deltaproteobacteria bacterium]|nr:AraC family transcriptional regulator [Deltaproteobacteria bacterium]